MTAKIYLKRILMILASVLALYTIAGFFLAPWAGKKILVKELGNRLGQPVVIGSVFVNPLSLVLDIKDLAIKEKEGGDFISVSSLLVDLSMGSLFKFAPVIEELELESLVVNLILKKDGSFNFSDLIQRFEKNPQDFPLPDSTLSEPEIFGFQLSNTKISNAHIRFSDQISGKDHVIKNFNLNLPLLSTIEKDKQTKTVADMDFVLNQAQIKIKIESLPFTPGRDTVVTLKTGSIDLLPYLKYLPLPETFLVKRMETSLDLAMTYSQVSDKEKPSLIVKGDVGIANIDIQDADRIPVLSVPQIDITLSPSDLLDKRLGLASLKILSPKVYLTRDANGGLNLLKLLPEGKISMEEEDIPKPEKEGAMVLGGDKETPGFAFQLDSGEIVDASLSFTDLANKTPFKTILSPVAIQVSDIMAQKGVLGNYSISLKTEADESMASAGQFSTTPLALEGSVTLEKLVLKKYLPYVENFINFDLQEGQLNLDAGFTLSEDDSKLAIMIHNKELRLINLRVWDRVNKEIPVSIPEVIVTGSVLDTGEQRLDMGKIKTSKGKILLKRQADGTINLVNNLLPHIPQGNQTNTDKVSPSIGADKNKGPAWEISLSDVSLGKYEIDVSDEINKDPISINVSDISLHANNLKTEGREKAGISVGMILNKTGEIQVKGDLVLSDLAADLAVSLDKIDIQSFQPYFTEQVNILVTKGFIQTQGQLSLSMKEKNNPRVSFKGKSSVTDFVSLGKFSGKEFFKCNSFYLSGMDISLLPVKVAVKDISLTDFYSRVIISEKGDINLRQIMAGSEKGKSGSQAEPASAVQKANSSPRPEITISNVTLQGGAIYFEDNFTQPNVFADMKEIAGKVTGLSSMEGLAPGDLELHGLHGQSSPLDIVGRISPLTQKQFLDLNISFKDIELTRFSSYSAKYIGYEIEKGKLVLDLNYQIDGNLLEARNRFFLDQFTLGGKVDSKDATSLPVPLAISLLKNNEGQIDLNVPLSGNLDDPEFSFSVAFFEVLGNLIMKVITSPFKALGAIFGGGEDLGFVNFEYGSDAIPDNQIQKINKLIEILEKKKELQLEIEGTYDKIADGNALRNKAYDALIKSEKLKILAAKGTPVSSPEQITLLPEEREAAVLAAYELADFPKPREKDGKEKQISTEEKEKLLLTHMDINEQQLMILAMARAGNIKNHILSTAKVLPERIFLLNPGEAEAGPDQETFGRVIFSIK
jgi:uncharacterized protein involved in outer membrane biogenesis